MEIKKLFKVWFIIAKNIIQNQLLTTSSSVLFFIGKLFNFIFAIIIVYSIYTQVSTVNGYTMPQVIITTLVFSFLDSLTQFLFRSLYTFRPILLRGDFDMDLLKPLPSFFRPILSGPDFLDLPMIIIELVALVYTLFHFSILPGPQVFFISLLVFINAIIIAFSIHLLIAAFSVITTEVDSLVMIYRTFGRTAVFPTDIYNSVFRFMLNYIIPITVIFTVPAKSLLGLLDNSLLIYSLTIAFIFLFSSVKLWVYSLSRYTSASS